MARCLFYFFVMAALPACSSSPQSLHRITTGTANQSHGLLPASASYSWWEGNTKSNQGFIRHITLQVIRTGNELSGFYLCRSGNAICRDLNDYGTITGGKIEGSSLNLLIRLSPDNSNCVYLGTLAGNSADGSYTCYQMAAIVERGTWRAERMNP